VAGGRFLPKRLDAAYGALARAQARKDALVGGAGQVLNRGDYVAYYYGDRFADFLRAYGGWGNAGLNKKND